MDWGIDVSGDWWEGLLVSIRKPVLEEFRFLVKSQQDEYAQLRQSTIQIIQYGLLISSIFGIGFFDSDKGFNAWLIFALLSLLIQICISIYIVSMAPYEYQTVSREIIKGWISGKLDESISESALLKMCEFQFKHNYENLKSRFRIFPLLLISLAFQVLFMVFSICL